MRVRHGSIYDGLMRDEGRTRSPPLGRRAYLRSWDHTVSQPRLDQISHLQAEGRCCS